MSIKKVRGLESNFSIIPNDTINDSLSWGAKGLLTYLCSKPDDWSVSVKQLCNHSKKTSKPTGRDGTYTIINELISKGYMKRLQARTTGQFANSEYIVSATPLADLPITDKAETVEPTAVNPTLQSKELNKVNIVTKESIKEPLSEPKVQTKKYTFDSYQMEFAVWMHSQLLIQNPNFKKPNLESWANTLRLMLEVDKRDSVKVGEVFTWANQDPFWSSNILSPVSLRKQFDKLIVKANQPIKTKTPISNNSTEWIELAGDTF